MKREKVLWIEEERPLDPVDQEDAAKAGFDLMQKRSLDVWSNFLDHLDKFVAIVFVLTERNNQSVFRTIKSVNDHQVISDKHHPIVFVIPPIGLPDATRVDASPVACASVPKLSPKDVFPFIRTLLVIQEAIEEHRVVVWHPTLPGQEVIFGPMGTNNT
jgi:hypothetical protein